MLYYFNQSTNPYFNAALEDYIFSNKNISDDVILVWINEPSIFIGKNQNPYEEVKSLDTSILDIPLIRRISGGGTVFHDLGNINFSFIGKNKKLNEINFELYNKFMIDMINSLSFNTYSTSRKDIFLDGKKISGSAQYIKGKNILYHATLLFDSDLDKLNFILNNRDDVVSSSTKSVRSKVCNVSDFYNNDLSSFIDDCFNYINTSFEEVSLLEFSMSDISSIKDLEHSKYKSISWNYEKTPTFTISTSFIPINSQTSFDVYIEVSKWKINRFTLSTSTDEYEIEELYGELFFKHNIENKIKEEFPKLISLLNKIF